MNHFPVSLILELIPVFAFAEWYPLSEISKFVVLAMFGIFSKVLHPGDQEKSQCDRH
jgi:hypothetical protein